MSARRDRSATSSRAPANDEVAADDYGETARRVLRSLAQLLAEAQVRRLRDAPAANDDVARAP